MMVLTGPRVWRLSSLGRWSPTCPPWRSKETICNRWSTRLRRHLLCQCALPSPNCPNLFPCQIQINHQHFCRLWHSCNSTLWGLLNPLNPQTHHPWRLAMSLSSRIRPRRMKWLQISTLSWGTITWSSLMLGHQRWLWVWWGTLGFGKCLGTICFRGPRDQSYKCLGAMIIQCNFIAFNI